MLELTITLLYLIEVSEAKLSTPTMTNAEECFPNYSKMEQPIGKGMELTYIYMSWNRYFIEHGQPHA